MGRRLGRHRAHHLVYEPTILPEAMEKWSIELFRSLLPRIYMIVEEIDRRWRESLAKPAAAGRTSCAPPPFCGITRCVWRTSPSSAATP